MKVLTIRQPWASLIINGYKKYEFRSWKTNYRGKILIHTSCRRELENIDRFSKYKLTYIDGAIIGEATLTSCIPVDKEFEEELMIINPLVYRKSKHTRKYAWKLENIIKYDNPIYCKGRLGIWNYDGDKL